jgi:hypothetical protein
MVTQSTIVSIIIFYYQVVIIKHNHKSYMNMVIYHFYIWTQRISFTHIDGVAEIRINITLQDNNLTTRHT